MSLVDFLYAVPLDVPLDKPWIDFYHEASYKIGQDFFPTLDMDSSKHVLNITQDDIFQEKEGAIGVEEMWTIWAGLCYKFTPLYKTQKTVLHYFRIHFSQSLLDEDKPKIDMISCIQIAPKTNLILNGHIIWFILYGHIRWVR